MLLRDTQFLFRANHRVGIHTADLSAFEGDQHLAIGMAIINAGAFLCVSDLQRLRQRTFALEIEQVRRPGQYHLLLLSVEELAQHQAVRVGVRHHFRDGSHHKLLAIPFQAGQTSIARTLPGNGQADETDLLDLQAGHRHLVGQFGNGKVNIYKILQPGNWYFHRMIS